MADGRLKIGSSFLKIGSSYLRIGPTGAVDRCAPQILNSGKASDFDDLVLGYDIPASSGDTVDLYLFVTSNEAATLSVTGDETWSLLDTQTNVNNQLLTYECLGVTESQPGRSLTISGGVNGTAAIIIALIEGTIVQTYISTATDSLVSSQSLTLPFSTNDMFGVLAGPLNGSSGDTAWTPSVGTVLVDVHSTTPGRLQLAYKKDTMTDTLEWSGSETDRPLSILFGTLCDV